jgi:hypothetical protein
MSRYIHETNHQSSSCNIPGIDECSNRVVRDGVIDTVDKNNGVVVGDVDVANSILIPENQ